jgi:tetratricopeptide (TPR) repeat protein
VHQNIGSLLLGAGDGEGGLRHLEESLLFARKFPEARGRVEATARALANLGTAHQRLRRTQKAEGYYRESLALLEKDAKGLEDLLAAILDNFGTFYFEIGQRKECIETLERSLRLRLSLYGERSWTVVASYRQIGAAQRHFGAYPQSRQAFQEMRRLAELLGGLAHPLVGDALDGLATLALEQGDLLQARNLALAELAIRERHAASQPGELADSRNQLGQIQHKLGRDDRAADDFRAALGLWEKLHTPSSPQPGRTWGSHGSPSAISTLPPRRSARPWKSANRPCRGRMRMSPTVSTAWVLCNMTGASMGGHSNFTGGRGNSSMSVRR